LVRCLVKAILEQKLVQPVPVVWILSHAGVGASVVTLKAAIRGHFKTGHRDWPET